MERCSEWVQQQQQERNLISDQFPLEEEEIDDPTSQESFSHKKKSFSDSGNGRNNPLGRTRKDSEGVPGPAKDDVDNAALKEDVGKKQKRLDVRSIVLDLHCGWSKCSFVSKNMQEFIKHVSFHIPEVDVRLYEDDEGAYACCWEDCDFETSNGDEISRHVNYHSFHTKSKAVGDYITKSLNLPQCQYESRGHNFVPDQSESLTCHWTSCIHTSNNINYFIDHVNSHCLDAEPNQGKKIKCCWKGCNFECNARYRILDHFRTHTQEKPVACSVCGSLFSSRTKLEDHLKAQAPSEKRNFQCSNCSRYYPSERLLRDHMRQHINHYKCRFCDMTCPTARALSLHIRYRHLDDKPFSCRFCSHRSKTQQDLTTHFLSHVEGKSFQCIIEGCKYSCRALTSLRWHYRKVHSKSPSHSCHICEEKFYRGSALTKHLVEKHDFHWPSGHSRFRYKEDDDGLFRLQTVRYESLEVTQQIMSSDYNTSTAEISGRRFVVEKRQVPDGSSAVANFLIKEGDADDSSEDIDDPEDLEVPGERKRNGASMPELNDYSEVANSKRTVLISIEEVDSSGKVLKKRTLEAEQVDSLYPSDCAKPIEDGYTFLD